MRKSSRHFALCIVTMTVAYCAHLRGSAPTALDEASFNMDLEAQLTQHRDGFDDHYDDRGYGGRDDHHHYDDRHYDHYDDRGSGGRDDHHHYDDRGDGGFDDRYDPRGDGGADTRDPRGDGGADTRDPRGDGGADTRDPRGDGGADTRDPRGDGGADTRDPRGDGGADPRDTRSADPRDPRTGGSTGVEAPPADIEPACDPKAKYDAALAERKACRARAPKGKKGKAARQECNAAFKANKHC